MLLLDSSFSAGVLVSEERTLRCCVLTRLESLVRDEIFGRARRRTIGLRLKRQESSSRAPGSEIALPTDCPVEA